MEDSRKPDISPVNFSNGKMISGSQKTLKLKLTDNFSGIDSERIYCILDGEWILFEYDYKRDMITHHLKGRPSQGAHTLEVTTYDGADNSRTKAYTLVF